MGAEGEEVMIRDPKKECEEMYAALAIMRDEIVPAHIQKWPRALSSPGIGVSEPKAHVSWGFCELQNLCNGFYLCSEGHHPSPCPGYMPYYDVGYTYSIGNRETYNVLGSGSSWAEAIAAAREAVK
jgi:hypothetical protein